MSRICTLTQACPGAGTPQPATTERCDHLQCGGKPALRDRILCRLNLAPAGVARELELQYSPEECRALSDKAARAACISRYLSFKPCWAVPAGAARFSCARDVLRLVSDIPAAVKKCAALKRSASRLSCRNDLRAGVAAMVKFRFYDLEQRAEYLASEGEVALSSVADLDTTIETKKQAFNRAKTLAAKLQIVRQVRAAWSTFLGKVGDKAKLSADERKDYLDDALSDLRAAQ